MGGTAGELAFIPDRLVIQPGEAVRWVVQSAGHSTTAYHPDSHALYESRIPAAAKPWDSGVLLNVGENFEHRFDEPGVYQYYCIPHEGSGMVGTIVVGTAADGPGTSGVQEEVPVAARTKLEELADWARQQS